MRRKWNWLITFWMVILSLALASCRGEATPTFDSQAATLQAAARQTVAASEQAALLTARAKLNQQITPSPTFTLPPTLTRTPTPTFTPTVTRIPSRTPTPLPSATPTGTPSPYTCLLVEQSPRDGATVKPESKVTVRWTLKNIGTATWDAKAIDFYQVGGAKIAEKGVIDLPQTVKPGETVEIAVVLKIPEVTGPYRTDWKLVEVESAFSFCPVYIEVWASP